MTLPFPPGTPSPCSIPSQGDGGSFRVPGLLAALTLALVFALPAFASIPSSSLTGQVLVDGKPAAGVSITAWSAALEFTRTTVTTSSGAYWIEVLPPGVYDVTFSLAGHTSLTRRAVIELARVVRVDASLQASEDEESVTSTARSNTVAETQPATTHFSGAALDRLPIRRDPRSASHLAPVPLEETPVLIDGVGPMVPGLYGQELFDQVTVLRGAIPIEYESSGSQAIAVARIRSGGDRWFLSLRDTLGSESWTSRSQPSDASDGVEHLWEAAGGGPLVRERLWIFGTAWRGEELRQFFSDVRGAAVKLTAQPGLAHGLSAAYIAATDREMQVDTSQTSLQYVVVPAHQWTLQAQASRSTFTYSYRPSSIPQDSTADDTLFVKSSYALSTPTGDHLVSAGGDFTRFTGGPHRRSTRSLFLSDRWSLHRLTLHLGARRDSGEFLGFHTDRITPRFGVTWDINGDGRTALFASHSVYAHSRLPLSTTRETMLGFALAIGGSGHARIDAIRREEPSLESSGIALEGGYRLFDRFEIAGNGTFVSNESHDELSARVWASAALPIGENEFGVTLLERYFSELDHTRAHSTDLALRYTMRFSSVALTTAADLTGLVSSGEDRALRVWFRAQL